MIGGSGQRTRELNKLEISICISVIPFELQRIIVVPKMAEEQANEHLQKLVSESEAQTEPVEPTEADCGYAHSWSVLGLDVPPRQTSHFYKQFMSAENHNNFFKSVKWSPDGSCFLTILDDNAFRLFDVEVPSNAGESKEDRLLLMMVSFVFEQLWNYVGLEA
ncbi:hypothetical protein Sjap_002784 [Stephania japonica]|uniref:Uncharacterized protein n=1 Tax=Stephania japonica TaxID=461633 RepID=A0AAP0PUV1_9MAGN